MDSMFGTRLRHLTASAVVAAAASWSAVAQAQFFGSSCGCGGQPIAPMAAPIISGSAMQMPMAYGNPCGCNVQPIACNVCNVQPVAQYQPITETAYRDVQVVEYQPVQKPTKQARVVTVQEERDVTVYKTVSEARTVSVPSYEYQQVTECRPVTVNQSCWRTVYQPVPKMSPCQYDQRSGLLGEFNRMGYAMRNSFTPNQVARREFVPNVALYSVPQTRTVAVPTTKQVTYNVARMVPVTEKQQVAVQKVIWEDTTYTAYEPVTSTRRVAYTTTRMALVPFGESATSATAASPTPAGQTAESGDKGSTKQLSSPTNTPPLRHPIYQSGDVAPSEPEPTPSGPVASRSGAATMHTVGWRTHQPKANETPVSAPELSVAAK